MQLNPSGNRRLAVGRCHLFPSHSARRTPTSGSHTHTGQRPPLQVEFRDVSFRFPTRPEVLALDRVRLRLTPGRLVALVGSSGSGKSTLVGLLQRLYDATDGQVPSPAPPPLPPPLPDAHARALSHCCQTGCLSAYMAHDDCCEARLYVLISLRPALSRAYPLHTPCTIATCGLAL